MLRSMLTNRYASVFTANLTILGLSMVTSIVLARNLGPTGCGEIAAAILWSALLVALGSLGMSEAVLYFVAQPHIKTQHIFANGLGMALIQSIILVPFGYVAMPRLLASQSPDVVQASRALLVIVPISLLTQYNRSILQGRMKINSYNAIQIMIPAGTFCGVLMLYRINGLNIDGIVFLLILLNAIAMFASLLLLLVHRIPIGLKSDLSLARSMLGYGIQAQIGTMFSNANLRLDQVLLAGWVAPGQLGLYVVAVSASSVSSVLSRTVATVATPLIARQRDPQQQIKQLQSIFRDYWYAGMVLKLAFGLLLPWGIPWIYGAEFGEAVVVAEVLLLASLFLDASYVLMAEVRGLGASWLVSRSEMVASGVTVVLLLTLLPSQGIMGAAITSLLAYATALGVLVIGLRHRHAISLKELFGPARAYFAAQTKASPAVEGLPDSRFRGVIRPGARLVKADFSGAHLVSSNFDHADLSEASMEAANLEIATLKRAILVRAKLGQARLTKAGLQGANLQYAALAEAQLSEAKLQGADLRHADLSRAHLAGTDLEGADLSGASLVEAWLHGATLDDARLGDADLSGAYLGEATLCGASLPRATLSDSTLPKAKLVRADLSRANLRRARLVGANLRMADLTDADLQGAFLNDSNLQAADLTGANLRGANLTGANVQGAWLDGAQMDESTILPDGTAWTPEVHDSLLLANSVLPAAPRSELQVDDRDTDAVLQAEPSTDASKDQQGVRSRPEVTGLAPLLSKLLSYKVARNTSVLLLAQTLSRFIGIFYIAALARYVGPDGVGKISTATTLNGLMILIIAPGLETLLVRDIASDSSRAIRYLSNSILIRVLLYGPFVALTLIVAHLADYPATTLAIIRAYMVVYGLDILGRILIAGFQAFERMEYEAITRVTHDVVNVVLSLLAIYFKQSLVVIAFMSIVAQVVQFALLVVFMRGYLGKFRFEIDLKLGKSLLVTSIPFAALIILFAAQLQIGTFILSLYYSSKEVGVYAAASTIIMILLLLPTTFSSAIFPSFSRLFAHNPDDLRRFYQVCFKALVVAGFPLGMGTILIADRVIDMIYGSEFHKAAFVLQIMAIRLFIFVGYSNGPLLNATGRQNFFAWTQAIGVGINVGLSFAFIPLWGSVGAAVAFVVSGFVTFIVHSLACHRQFNLPLPWGTVGRVTLATTIMGIIAYLTLQTRLPWLTTVFLVGPLAYGAGIIALRLVNRAELKLLAGASLPG